MLQLEVFVKSTVAALQLVKWSILALAAPLAMPFAFGLLYDRVNREWTVQTFGCGCPDLQGNYRSFNANHFNMIVWSVVFLCCVATAIYFSSRTRNCVFCTCLSLVSLEFSAFACYSKFAAGIWL
jgi:hypothetical protein